MISNRTKFFAFFSGLVRTDHLLKLEKNQRRRFPLYIDGVFSGGGIKGLAYIGAYQALEEHGFQFKRVAGTSAGAIIAAFIAAGFTSEELNNELGNLELRTILDEPKSILPYKLFKWLPIYWRLGMYKGQALENWLDQTLQKKAFVHLVTCHLAYCKSLHRICQMAGSLFSPTNCTNTIFRLKISRLQKRSG